MKNIIVFASGGGSNFEALAEACKSGYINGRIVLLVAGKAGIGAIEKAKKFDIPVFVENQSPCLLPQAAGREEKNNGEQFSPFCKGSAAEGGRDLIKILQDLKPDLICLAGYLKKIPQEILKICPVMNIHPALLPNFGGKGMYGHFVHEAVIKSGAKKSGATVHFINRDYDEGQIIKQVEVPVLANDTPQILAARILEEEHKLYPLCVKLFCEGKI
ncbi:MAG: phosphoribosylglycinamide formyltransferase [Elusimicrobiota bacterium]|jgi:formyltetrahydrofolate-dependent phosphoribosylglycinamide formyltransferase|nr:phosphoribosylglycinamide formyltransferase [Elusimicrobiota bacterium]